MSHHEAPTPTKPAPEATPQLQDRILHSASSIDSSARGDGGPNHRLRGRQHHGTHDIRVAAGRPLPAPALLRRLRRHGHPEPRSHRLRPGQRDVPVDGLLEYGADAAALSLVDRRRRTDYTGGAPARRSGAAGTKMAQSSRAAGDPIPATRTTRAMFPTTSRAVALTEWRPMGSLAHQRLTHWQDLRRTPPWTWMVGSRPASGALPVASADASSSPARVRRWSIRAAHHHVSDSELSST